MAALLHLLEGEGKLRRAAEATTEIESLIGEVFILLGGMSATSKVNSLGVFVEPHARLTALRIAQEAIGKAIAEHLAVDWDLQAEYQANEQTQETQR